MAGEKAFSHILRVPFDYNGHMRLQFDNIVRAPAILTTKRALSQEYDWNGVLFLSTVEKR